MPYYNVSPHTLFQSCMAGSGEYASSDNTVARARAWVEAENIYDVWKLVQEWYTLMENDEAKDRYPDPYWNDDDYPDKAVLTQEVADKFIEEMDADFMLEKNRFQGRLPPEFSRLPAHARLAFVQEAYRVIKSTSAIHAEADERLAAGEVLPPRKPS